MDILKQRGHETEIAISYKHSSFLTALGVNHHILSDIQETDSGGFPSFKWFSNIEIISRCIKEELELLNRVKPDRVLGVFRFTLRASSKIAEIPYDSLICGCLLPEFNGTLGYTENEEDAEQQKQLLDNFFRFAGAKTSLVLEKFGLKRIDDIRFALKGERTYLWDFPDFMPLKTDSKTIHVGPITLNRWPYDTFSSNDILDSKLPLAVVSFGTCINDKTTILRMVKILVELGYKVIVAAGGQRELMNHNFNDPRVVWLNFAPLNKIFPFASLLVTHGGQMTIFEALQNQVPVCVMPLQPEQSHNGVCLERIGCGTRLIPSTLFSGIPEDYIQAFYRMTDEDIKTKIVQLINNMKTKENLAKVKQAMGRYHGAKTLVDSFEVQ